MQQRAAVRVEGDRVGGISTGNQQNMKKGKANLQGRVSTQKKQRECPLAIQERQAMSRMIQIYFACVASVGGEGLWCSRTQAASRVAPHRTIQPERHP